MQKKQKYAENKPQFAKAVRKKTKADSKKNKGGHQNRNKVGLQKKQRRTEKKNPKVDSEIKTKAGNKNPARGRKPCSRPRVRGPSERARWISLKGPCRHA